MPNFDPGRQFYKWPPTYSGVDAAHPENSGAQQLSEPTQTGSAVGMSNNRSLGWAGAADGALPQPRSHGVLRNPIVPEAPERLWRTLAIQGVWLSGAQRPWFAGAQRPPMGVDVRHDQCRPGIRR
jgi:hypothetical protein